MSKKSFYPDTVSVPAQIIYLDFDGASTSFNGSVLQLDSVSVNDSALNMERIRNILLQLNARFAGENVVFVSERPAAGRYSTIFVGKSRAFENYGNFAGISETVDHGNLIPDDNAFVLMDAGDSDAAIVEAIAHESGHLTGTLDHGGKGLESFAMLKRADLNVSDYGVSSNNISTDEPVVLTFRVNNTGTYDAGYTSLRIYDGNRILRELSLDPIAAGSGRNCRVTVTSGALSAGTHKLWVEVDAWDSVVESREDNNRAYRTVNVRTASKPDLNITNYEVSSNNIVSTEALVLNFRVNNTGNADAGTTTLKVYDGDRLLRTVSVGAIAAGGGRNCRVTVPASSLSGGTHKIYLVVDAGNTENESREDNNRAYRTVNVRSVPKADLHITNYEVSSNSIYNTESVVLTFRVNNSGTAAAGATTLKVYDGERLLRTVSVGEIAAGGGRNCYLTVPAGTLTAGSHKLYVVADAGNAVSEAREDNNRAYRTVNVRQIPPDLSISNFNVSTANVDYGSIFTINFDVDNLGDGAAAASTAYIYADDKLIGQVAIPELASRGKDGWYYRVRNHQIQSDAVMLPGEHNIRVVADGRNVLAESDETDNSSVEKSISVDGFSWAVFVYMAADNNLEEYALKDILEMQKAVYGRDVDVYVLCDRSTGYSTAHGNWSDTRVGKINASTGTSITVDWESWGELDSGDVATLDRFLEWGEVQAAGVDNCALVMWNHGNGFLSCMSDDTGTSMRVNEIAESVSNSDLNITVMGFDACLMGMAEVVSCFDGVTDYLVASEYTEYAGGWQWTDFLSAIDRRSSSFEVSDAMVDVAVGNYNIESLVSVRTDGRLVESLCDCAEASENFTASDWQILAQSAIDSLFDGGYMDVLSYADMYDFLNVSGKNISSYLSSAVTELKNGIADAVVSSCTDPDNYGLSFYSGVDITESTGALRSYRNEPYLLDPELQRTPLGSEQVWVDFVCDLHDAAANLLGSGKSAAIDDELKLNVTGVSEGLLA